MNDGLEVHLYIKNHFKSYYLSVTGNMTFLNIHCRLIIITTQKITHLTVPKLLSVFVITIIR